MRSCSFSLMHRFFIMARSSGKSLRNLFYRIVLYTYFQGFFSSFSELESLSLSSDCSFLQAIQFFSQMQYMITQIDFNMWTNLSLMIGRCEQFMRKLRRTKIVVLFTYTSDFLLGLGTVLELVIENAIPEPFDPMGQQNLHSLRVLDITAKADASRLAYSNGVLSFIASPHELNHILKHVGPNWP